MFEVTALVSIDRTDRIGEKLNMCTASSHTNL